MKLELTEAEHELTLDVLQSRLGDLQQQIHHSTVSDFTDQLKQMETLLKRVISKLESMQSSQNEGST